MAVHQECNAFFDRLKKTLEIAAKYGSDGRFIAKFAEAQANCYNNQSLCSCRSQRRCEIQRDGKQRLYC